jgi:HAD superfamily hydrolase (TIGR01490 family)
VRAAFFDLDKTVIARASVVAFGGPLRRRGLVNRRTVARAVLGQLLFLWFGADEEKMAKIRQSMLEVSAGWDRDEVRAIVEETLTDVIEPLIYAEAQSLISLHRAAGDRIWLVSSAPSEIVEPLAAMLGVDGAIASKAEIDELGRYTGKIEFYAQGEGKATAIRALAESHHLDLDESSAYSDSVTDLPMLETVGHPFAVNPDRALAKEAKERGWEILQFSNPVRLRDRASVRLPAFTGALVLVGLLLAGLGRTRGRAAA